MARIRDRAQAETLVYTYRLPARRFAPRVWLWSAFGGLGLGVALALALTVAGQIKSRDATFREVLAGGTLAGAVVFYLFCYRLSLYRMVLRITFDAARQAVGIQRMKTRGTQWYPYEEVIAFRLVRHAEGWQRGCGLVMDTESAGPVEVVLADLPCYERTGLPHLVRRLSAHLDSLRADDDDYPLPPQPAVMNRAPLGAPEPSGQRRLPDPRDVHH